MRRFVITVLFLPLFGLLTPALAQDRVKPKAAKGGKAFGEPWTEVPDFYKNIRLDAFKLADLAAPPLALISATRLASSDSRRAPTTTLAPSAAKSFAVARPMPELAPVTMATLL